MVRAVLKRVGDSTLDGSASGDLEVVSRRESAVDIEGRSNESARAPAVDEGEDSGHDGIVRGHVTTGNEVPCARDSDIGSRRHHENADGEGTGEQNREARAGVVGGGPQSEHRLPPVRSSWRQRSLTEG